MLGLERISSQLQRAVLVGVGVVALAHLPPVHLAQHLNGIVFDVLSAWLPADTGTEIQLVDLNSETAMPALSADDRATIIGPGLLVLGPIRGSAPVEGLVWLAALAGIFLLLARGSQRLLAGSVSLIGPAVLLTASAASLIFASLWVPVVGPALLLLTTGLIAIASRRDGATTAMAAAPAPESGADLLAQGDLEAAWESYRALPPTTDLLPELHGLGTALEDGGYPELAADVFLRIALVDPEFRDVAFRLASTGRPDAFDSEATRQQLRSEMPSRLGRYRLLEPVGQGTTGRVFLARDPRINRLVAIKLIDLSLERDESEVEDARERFMREAETAGRLQHPNIVTIFDVGQSKGRAYIAMEYLKGDLLSRFTSTDTLLPPGLVLELGALAADALDYAHSQNVIHRDIKPGNIMYDSVSGDLKITDFGIARLIDVDRTRTGVVLGTPSFMAPEQIEGGNVKGHTDLFALGVSLYELLSGRLPFRGNSMTNLMFVIANEPHERLSSVRPGLPGDLDEIIDIALGKDPAARFARGADMADALRRVARQVH